jgi:transposase
MDEPDPFSRSNVHFDEIREAGRRDPNQAYVERERKRKQPSRIRAALRRLFSR